MIEQPCATCGKPSGVTVPAGIEQPSDILPPITFFCSTCWTIRNAGRKTFR